MKKSVLTSYMLRTLVQSIFFSTLLFAIIACFYWQSREMGAPLNPLEYFAMFAFMIFFGLLQWIVQKSTLSALLADRTPPPKTKNAGSTSPDPADDRDKRKNREKQLFVHLFGVLQREGRLMDFLREDLSLYEDAQIGAAVRSIHENCKKTIQRYLAPIPVMQQAEGETVEIADGFDRHAVKLVGNVVGQPPFTGILRHRGWQLQSIALPELADAENPNLIAPAEIEIQ